MLGEQTTQLVIPLQTVVVLACVALDATSTAAWAARSGDGRQRLKHVEPVRDLTYTVDTWDGATCILAQTEAAFSLEYHTYSRGVQTAEVRMPARPSISGRCDGGGGGDDDTSTISMMWSIFNFTLAFTKNPEGNSYYLNRATLRYNQSAAASRLFHDATYRGVVHLQTRRDKNYYFTSLGKSYVCRAAEDQGPLPLVNSDDELVGSLSLFRTRFQPFVKRAKGVWGQEHHCLAKSVQVMREQVVPFVALAAFTTSVAALVVTYALYHKLHVRDVAADGEKAAPAAAYQEYQMDVAAAPETLYCGDADATDAAADDEEATPEAICATPYGVTVSTATTAANPFATDSQKAAHNPFKTSK